MYTMSGISSISNPAVAVTDSALTVKCPPGDNFALKIALTLLQPGQIIVVDAQGFSDWCLGGFQMLTSAIRDRGLKALIVNGAYRDVADATAAKFPLYAKSVATWSGPKIGSGEINVPVCCGGVIVQPGDIITASEEGVVVVPHRFLGRILDHLGGPGGSTSKQMSSDARPSSDAPHLDYLEEIERAGRLVWLD